MCSTDPSLEVSALSNAPSLVEHCIRDSLWHCLKQAPWYFVVDSGRDAPQTNSSIIRTCHQDMPNKEVGWLHLTWYDSATIDRCDIMQWSCGSHMTMTSHHMTVTWHDVMWHHPCSPISYQASTVNGTRVCLLNLGKEQWLHCILWQEPRDHVERES